MAATGTYAPDPDLHIVDANNLPVSGGLIWTYLAGTTTPTPTYSDVGLSVVNANPIVAGADGRFVAFLAPGNAYKFVYEMPAIPPALHGVVIATRDNITAIPISSPSTDVVGSAGDQLAAGSTVYLSSGLGGKVAGQWYLADADFDYSSTLATIVGIAINPAAVGTQALIRIAGQVGIQGQTFLPGTVYYVSTTAGTVTATPPAYQRLVGQALDVATLAIGMPGAGAGAMDILQVEVFS